MKTTTYILVFLNDQKSLLDRLGERKVISLNESVRLQEKSEYEQATLTLENKRRKAKGLVAFGKYDDLKTFNEERTKKQAATAGTTVIDTKNDALLREAGYILKDFSELLTPDPENKVATTVFNKTN